LFFIDDEFNCYLDNIRTPQALPETDPFQWWIDHELKFLILFKLARKYLSIPATSVPSRNGKALQRSSSSTVFESACSS